MLLLYKIISILISPFLPLFLKNRARKGKEDVTRMNERFGYASIPRPDGEIIWFHAASMGEANSILPLIDEILTKNINIYIILTTVTTSSARHVASHLHERAFHQFAPIDTPFAIVRFLRHWRPNKAIWVESEIWPNMILQTRKFKHKNDKKCKIALINGRISNKSFRRWQNFPRTIAKLLLAFDVVLAKSSEDLERLIALGAEDVRTLGNLKFSAPPLEANSKNMAEILQQIGSRPIWLASSTHNNEEEMVANIHANLKEIYPDLLTIIAPRHETRGLHIQTFINEIGLKTALRSSNEQISIDTDIYIADTMGELGIFYRIASIVFIGGSLVPHGGQNPFEAALLDCAILYGDYMNNFKEFCIILEKFDGAIKVTNANILEREVNILFRDQVRQENLAINAMKAVNSCDNAMNEIIEIIIN